jgi:hypothetical protein
VVAAASVEARNTQTGVVTTVASSATGNYTIPSLSVGDYEIRVSVSGFKKFIRQGLGVQNAQTIRIDIALEVGSAAEAVTVTEAAPLLKTESGELSHVVPIERMNSLPVLQTGGSAGSGGIRNPIAVVALIPGSAMTIGVTGPTVRINGGVNNSQTMLVEGMDASNSLGQGASQQNQVGVDSVQEFAIQTSNYAAEFGQAGSAIMNITMRSGTNAFHGSAYEYFVHEKFSAGQPLLNIYNSKASTIANGNPRAKTRRNDYGFTIGGPAWIPKVYDGRNRTFFFVNWEQYRAGANVIADAISVPTAAYRLGDFNKALLPNSLGTDPAGNVIFPNMIYDPTTRRTIDGKVVTAPFLGNAIPTTQLDKVALKVQDLIPNSTNSGLLVNNFQGGYLQERVTQVPSVKIDQVVNAKNKVAFLMNRTSTKCDFCAGADGLPLPVSSAIGTYIRAHTERLNWDTTLSPTMLVHWGIGFTQNWLGRPALGNLYDATAGLGLKGPFTGRLATFPNFTGLSNTQSGGSKDISSTGALADDVFQQGTAILSLTWVKGNHTYKFGGELRNQGDYRLDESDVNGNYAFGPQQTALPYVVAANSLAQIGNNTIGFPYASFLLGLVNNGNVKPGSRGRIGKKQLGFYAQDTWKITRKLTLDYGLRYDYSTYFQEQYGRMANLAPNLANPTAGGHPGAVQYEATCNCHFANNYPWAFGPRLGLAYQITPKTVLRAGFGVAYSGTPQYNLAGGVVSATNPFGPNPDSGREVMTLAGGLPLTPQQIVWPNFTPGYYPVGGALVGAGPGSVVDQNAGRPGRQYQWSIGLQREVTRDLVVEASYVANRQIWLTSGNMVNYNFIPQDTLKAYNLSLNSAADLAILSSQITAAGAGRFQNKLPYTGFTGTVAQSLRPFPQFNGGLTPLWAPLGKTWYDSLQVKATKRFSHGVDFTYAFTYSKELDTLSSTSMDVENRQLFKGLSSNSRPFINGLAVNYRTPGWSKNKWLSYAVRDWEIGTFFQYASGLPFAPPAATSTPALGTAVFQNTLQNRVPGVPLFTQDLNCHCFDPNTTFVLNPKAWTNPAAGQFGSATYYNDYRRQRHPIENLAFGRNFRIKERISLNVRLEFTNVFNRAIINDPTSINPQGPQTLVTGSTQTSAGFGFINNATLNQGTFATGGGQPRQGQLVGRFQF